MAEKNGNKRKGRDSKGKFAPGNSGRPKGSVSESVHLARRVAAKDSEELMKKAVSLALDGDIPLLKMFVDKLLGKRLDSGLTVPVSKSPQKMTQALLKGLQTDSITADDAAGFVQIIDLHLKAVELEDVQTRLQVLEDAK